MHIEQAKQIVRPWMNLRQWSFVMSALRGEERQFYAEKLIELAGIIESMPVTYESKETIGYLRYFKNGITSIICEKDVSCEGPGPEFQSQAYGWQDLGYGGEYGYISVNELIRNNCELDFHYTPRAI